MGYGQGSVTTTERCCKLGEPIVAELSELDNIPLLRERAGLALARVKLKTVALVCQVSKSEQCLQMLLNKYNRPTVT